MCAASSAERGAQGTAIPLREEAERIPCRRGKRGTQVPDVLAGFLLQIAFELLSRVVRVLGGVVVGWVAGWGLSVGPLDGAGRWITVGGLPCRCNPVGLACSSLLGLGWSMRERGHHACVRESTRMNTARMLFLHVLALCRSQSVVIVRILNSPRPPAPHADLGCPRPCRNCRNRRPARARTRDCTC